MRVQGIALFALLVAGATGAVAGEIRGVVRCAAGSLSAESPVVVWIEGLPKRPAPTEHLMLSQREVRFSPAFLVAVVGQTVDMPNDDDVTHNVFSLSPAKAFNLGLYPKGQSRSLTLDRPGLVDLFCKIHRHMNAKILVVPHDAFAVVREPGAFSIAGLPAGTYKVRTWHDDLAAQEQSITVPARGHASVNFTLTDASAQAVTP